MKYVMFMIGIILSVNGLSYIIIYLNLLVMGYSFFDYIKYITSKIECLSFFFGYLIIILFVFKRRKN